MLGQDPEPLSLPAVSHTDAQPDSAPALRTVLAAGSGVMCAIRGLAAQTGSTPFMVLFAWFALLLHQNSRQSAVTIGITSAARPLPELDGLIGMFVNTLPVRLHLPTKASASVSTLMTQTRCAVCNAVCAPSIRCHI